MTFSLNYKLIYYNCSERKKKKTGVVSFVNCYWCLNAPYAATTCRKSYALCFMQRFLFANTCYMKEWGLKLLLKHLMLKSWT